MTLPPAGSTPEPTPTLDATATQPPILIEPVSPAEEPALLALYERLLRAGPRIVALYRWRRAAEAASGGFIPYAAREGEAMVGAVSAWPVELARGGMRIPAAWQCDSIVDPALRGRGIAKRLVNALGARWELTLAKGTNPTMYALRKSVGFLDAPNREYLVRPLVALVSHGSWPRRLAAPLLYLSALVRGARAPRGTAGGALSIAPIERFSEEYDALADRMAGADEVTLVKRAAYLNWRYTTCPVRHYTLLEARAGGALRGAAVVRLPDERGGDGWIVDLIVDTRDDAAGMALLHAALAALRRGGAAWARTFATSQRARRWLAARGFIDSGQTPQFTYRVRGGAAGDDLTAAGWNIWHGDGDAELY